MKRPFAIALLAVGLAAAAETWTGGGKENGWNDGANWAEGRAPAASPGTRLFFDAPAGASFGFGGSEPLSFRDVLLGPSSGPVSFRGPGFALGGRPVSEPDVGWILESHGAVGAVVSNASPAALTFSAPVKAPWNLSVFATNGPVSFAKGLELSDRPLLLAGPGVVTIGGGQIRPSACTLRDVPLVLEGASFRHAGHALDVRGPDARVDLRRGAELQLAGGGWWGVFVRTPLSIGDPAAARDPSALVGPGPGSAIVFAGPVSFAPGCLVTNAYAIRFAIPSSATNRLSVAIPSGAKLVARTVDFFGQTDFNERTDTEISHPSFRVSGPDPKDLKAAPTVLETTEGSIRVGGRADRTSTVRASLSTEGRVEVLARAMVEIPSRDAPTHGNRATFGPGAAIRARGLSVGCATSNTLVRLSGATAELGDWGLGVGIESGRSAGHSVNAGLVVDNGSRVDSKGHMTVGRFRWNADRGDVAHDNYLKIAGGSVFRVAGLTVGHGLEPDHPLRGSSAVVSGAGSVLDLAGRSLEVGDGREGGASSCTLLVKGGAVLTNSSEVVVGRANAGESLFDRILVQGGAAFTGGDVRVGTCGNGGGRLACSNLLSVAGSGKRAALWDFGGRSLSIGTGGGAGARACDNEVAFLPGAEIRNLGAVVIGASGQNDLVSTGNVLRLAGGRVQPVKSLNIGPGNTLEIVVNPAFGKQGTRPLGIAGDFTLGGWKYGPCYVRPVAEKGARPGTYPVLAWKGNGNDLPHLRLHPDVPADRWRLDVDEARKLVTVTLLK